MLTNDKNASNYFSQVIYMIRNPKDQAVSWYHFSKTQPYADLPPYKDMYTTDKKKYFDEYIAGFQC